MTLTVIVRSKHSPISSQINKKPHSKGPFSCLFYSIYYVQHSIKKERHVKRQKIEEKQQAAESESNWQRCRKYQTGNLKLL